MISHVLFALLQLFLCSCQDRELKCVSNFQIKHITLREENDLSHDLLLKYYEAVFPSHILTLAFQNVS